MKTSEEVEEICKKLKPIIGPQADKLWYMYLAEDYQVRQQFALDIEILAEKLLKQETLSPPAILLPPPSPQNSSGTFFLGNAVYNSKLQNKVYLRHEDFRKQIGIFAVTGEGKTNLAYLLALQLLQQKVPFLVIDWKRSWRNLLSLQDKFPELKDVRVFTVGRDTLPFLWNPFCPPPGADKPLWVSTIADTLEKSHISGPGVAYYFNKIYAPLLKSLKGDFYPNFYDGLRYLENIKARERELRWKQTALRIFHSFTIGNASHVFNTRHPLHLEELLDKPVIIELDLEMPKALRIFISEMILRWIHLYRINQGETNQLRHVLFLEEVHNLFPQQTFNQETDSLENVYREIRAFGQGIVSITQHPSLLPVYLLGNCHTQLFLGLQHENDIRTARKSLFLKQGEEQYLNMLKVGECIAKIKNRIDPCLVQVPLVPVKKEYITDDWLKVNIPGYLPHAHVYKKPIAPPYLPTDIFKKQEKNKNDNPTSAKNIHHELLVDIYQNPFSSITQRYKHLKLNPKYGNKYKNTLISQGYIQPRKIITNKGWLILFDITLKGRMLLRDLGHDAKDEKEGIVHKFWKFRIADHYKDKGFVVLVEEDINGRPDIIVIDGKKRTAVEIETGKSDYMKNIERNLKAGFDEIICVATNKTVEGIIGSNLSQYDLCNKITLTHTLNYRISQ